MTTLDHWVDSWPPPEMEQMLRAARADQPDARLLHQTLTAMGVGGALGAAGLAGTAKTAGAAEILVPKSGVVLLVAKWGSVGLIGGALGVGALASVGSRRTHERPPAELSQPAPEQRGAMTEDPAFRTAPVDNPFTKPTDQATAATRSLRAARAEGKPEPLGESAGEGSSNVARFAPVAGEERERSEALPGGGGLDAPPASGVPATATPATTIDVRFKRELALVDAARAAIAARDPARALGFLAQRTREFGSSGHFAPEARFLQLEAYRQSGDRVRAREAARDILRKDRGGPHTDSAQRELGPDGH